MLFSLLGRSCSVPSLLLNSSGNYWGSIRSRPTRQKLLTHWTLQITELAPFCLPPFSLLRDPVLFPSLLLNSSGNYWGSIRSRPTRQELLTYWALQITELAPFYLLPFSFPSCSRQDVLQAVAVTRRAWGVKSSVHNIAFWQALPLREISRLRTFSTLWLFFHPHPWTLKNNNQNMWGGLFWPQLWCFGIARGSHTVKNSRTTALTDTWHLKQLHSFPCMLCALLCALLCLKPHAHTRIPRSLWNTPVLS